MTMENKTAVIVVADLHINSTVSLSPPVVNLDDGGTYRASRTQRWLWSCWTDFWAGVNRDATGYRKVLIVNGDLGELDTKRRSVQLITANKSTILSEVRDVLEVANWDALYIVRGTPAHVGKSAWLEEEIGKDFDAVESMPDVHSWYQIRATVNGKRFDIAHHTNGISKLGWNENSAASRIGTQAIWNYVVDRGVEAPDVLDRAHNHRCPPPIQVKNTHVYLCPCWSAMTEYGYRQGFENIIPSIGGLVHYVEEDGTIDTRQYLYEPLKERKVWQMKL